MIIVNIALNQPYYYYDYCLSVNVELVEVSN